MEEEIQQNGDDKNKMKNQSDNNKLMATLIKQISILHETNSKICRNLSDTKGNQDSMCFGRLRLISANKCDCINVFGAK